MDRVVLQNLRYFKGFQLMTQIREGGFQQIYTIFKQVLEFAYCKSCSNVSKVYQTRGLGSLINVPNGRLLFIFKFLDSFPDEE